MGEFVDTPMPSEFNRNGKIPEGGPGEYDGIDCPEFSSFQRTSSPNAVREKIIDGSVPKPSGESDQF